MNRRPRPSKRLSIQKIIAENSRVIQRVAVAQVCKAITSKRFEKCRLRIVVK